MNRPPTVPKGTTPFLKTPEEIRAVYDRGPDAVVALVMGLQEAWVRVAERVKALEDRASKDSHNSSKPPSSDDGFKPPTPKTKSQRESRGLKSGGQPGHEGKTLRAVETPQHVEVHSPFTCRGCGADLGGEEGEGIERRQVFDLPELALEVTEHQSLRKRCVGCGTTTAGAFPEGVTQPVQYGPRIKALGVYFQAYQLLPLERTSEALADLFGASLSVGTLKTALRAASQTLLPVEAQIRAALIQSPVAHFDETGVQIDGKLRWLHVTATPRLTFYQPHDKRGREALESIGILPDFTGWAIHDFFGSYLKYPCRHGQCNAHLLRELTYIEERFEQPWALQFKQLLKDAKAEVEQAKAAGAAALGVRRVNAFEKRYGRIVAEGLAVQRDPPSLFRNRRGRPTEPPRVAEGGDPEPILGPRKRGRKAQTPPKNLLDRLRKHSQGILAFLREFQVPFDNNLAERDLRMMKVQQKISGCFRTMDGAQDFSRLRGYISTLRKQGLPVLTSLEQVFRGDPRLPDLSA